MSKLIKFFVQFFIFGVLFGQLGNGLFGFLSQSWRKNDRNCGIIRKNIKKII